MPLPCGISVTLACIFGDSKTLPYSGMDRVCGHFYDGRITDFPVEKVSDEARHFEN